MEREEMGHISEIEFVERFEDMMSKTCTLSASFIKSNVWGIVVPSLNERTTR